MADTEEVSPATLLDELASLYPQARGELGTTLREVSESFAEVPDGRHSAHASAAGPLLELFSRA